VKSRNLRGFLAKARDLAGLTGIDPGRLGSNPLDLDPMAAGGSILSGCEVKIRSARSGSNGCGREQAARGGRRRPTVATGGEQQGLTGETRSRVPGLGSTCGSHLCAAGDAANLSRAARLVEAQWQRCTTRWATVQIRRA
jgi:hypothetical protein